MDTNYKHELTDYALELVHYKAHQLIGKFGIKHCDVDDIKQDLILDLLERLPKFDPAKAQYNTFVARIVERKISNMYRTRKTEKRDRRRESCSINGWVGDGQGGTIERVATMSQDEHDLRTDKYERPSSERADLQLDLKEVLSDLPVELRTAAELLMSMRPAQAARELGIPRSTFYETHLAQLRDVFKKRGLDAYMA